MKYKLPAILLTLFLVLSLVPAAFAAQGDGTKIADYCSGETTHPVATRILETYGDITTETEIMTLLCEDGYDFGQIMLALETYTILVEQGTAPETVADLLAQWTELGCWGEVWKTYDLAAGHKGTAQKNGGAPDEAGPELNRAGNGNLGLTPPDWAGPKDSTTVDGIPDWAKQGVLVEEQPGPGPAEFKGQATVEEEPPVVTEP
jgi:hypothetical protein